MKKSFKSLQPHSSIPAGDRYMCSRTFLYEIQFRTTFIWNFFSYDAYFWQRWALNWMYFAVSVYNRNVIMGRKLLLALNMPGPVAYHWTVLVGELVFLYDFSICCQTWKHMPFQFDTCAWKSSHECSTRMKMVWKIFSRKKKHPRWSQKRQTKNCLDVWTPCY